MPPGPIEIKIDAAGSPQPAALFQGLGLSWDESGVTGPDGSRAFLAPGPAGAFGLGYRAGGRTVRLTSALDPAAEDRRLVEGLTLKNGEGVLCFGLGLGYHLEELHRRLDPAAPLWVLESRPALAAAAVLRRALAPLFARPGFKLFVGPFGSGLPPGRPAKILWRPATRRYFAAEYPKGSAADPAGRPRRRPRRLLLFQSGYYLERELGNAARALGLETAAWRFPRTLTGRGESFRELLKLIKNFRPDLALTVNHLGFDAEGLMDDLFSRLSLPAASWFVDSPVFILGSGAPGPLVSAFSWDRDYLDFLRRRGFNRVVHLPLAADENFFRPAAASPRRPVAFVGDSLTAATDKYLLKLGVAAGGENRERFLAEVDRQAEAFLKSPALLPDPEPLVRLAEIFNLTDQANRLTDFQALVTWRAGRLWRLAVLAGQSPGLLHAAGDPGWGPLLRLPPGRLTPPLDYYADLAPYYQTSAVNLNITSAQMKTGLNQRVFDVPAAGAFLLTDRREQLFELFRDGEEVVTYQSPAEAAHLAAWYAARPEARRKIARAARARVLGGHLYRHRLAALLAALG
ncbi:MAG: glycosyltransferase [Candidatus Adiutrix sp.]|jgi:spore maturation protein CgeB|nr:glycosyltransferase [Candidatus Adiutrix sp.]